MSPLHSYCFSSILLYVKHCLLSQVVGLLKLTCLLGSTLHSHRFASILLCAEKVLAVSDCLPAGSQHKWLLFSAALRRKPQNPEVVIGACSQLMVDSGVLKGNQDAIQEKLEKVLGGKDPGNKNVANDLRKYLTYFLRGFVPVLLEDKEELIGWVLNNPTPVPIPETGTDPKKRKLLEGVEKAVGVDESMLGWSTQPLTESVEKDREIAAAKSEADMLRQKLEESKDREETVKKLSQKVKKLKQELERMETVSRACCWPCAAV